MTVGEMLVLTFISRTSAISFSNRADSFNDCFSASFNSTSCTWLKGRSHIKINNNQGLCLTPQILHDSPIIHTVSGLEHNRRKNKRIDMIDISHQGIKFGLVFRSHGVNILGDLYACKWRTLCDSVYLLSAGKDARQKECITKYDTVSIYFFNPHVSIKRLDNQFPKFLSYHPCIRP